MSTRATSRLIRFGIFEADLENARLTRQGIRIRLQEQPFRILARLLERPGQIVTREELRDELWPAGTYVDFDGSLNAALKRLRAALDDDADNPRFIETVPKRGYRFIAPVSVEESNASAPAEAPSQAPPAEILEQIRADSSASAPRLSRRRWLLPAGAAAAALGLIVFFAVPRRPASSRVSASLPDPDIGTIRHSVAVLGFQNASGQGAHSWLSTALAEMLRTELGAGGKLRVVSGESVSQFRASAPWSENDSLSRQTTSRIGKALESDLLVLGSFAAVGDPQEGSVRVDFRLQDAQTGEILYEGAESGSEKQFFGLVARIGAVLRRRLGLPMISESEEAGIVSSLPSQPDANRLYSLGLARSRDADLAAAKDLFLQAEKLAPQFPLVHLMLFRAWSGLGYDQRAKEEIKLAYQLSTGLPEVERLQVEAAYFGSLRDNDRAISACRALYALYPDSIDYAEQLIVALNAARRYEEAMAIVSQLRKLPAPASEDPRIDFWQAKLISFSGGPAQPFFEKAVAGAASRGERLLYARFRLDQCINLVYGSHPQGADAYCKEAYDIFMSAGNTLYAADALRALGDRRGSTGDLDGARELYEHALALLSKLGEHEKTGVVLNNMAITYENQGEIEQAERLFRRAAETWRESGDIENEAAALSNLGDVLMLRGQLAQAEKQYNTGLKAVQSTGSTYFAYQLYSISNIRLYEGDVAAASRYAARALAMAQARDDSADIPSALETQGAIRLAQADFAGARQSFEQARAILERLDKKGGVAEAQASLASVSIEEGDYSAAESALRTALAEFQADKLFLDEVAAETDLSRALLQEGKVFDARQAISAAAALSAGSSNPSLRLPVAIQEARIETAEIAASAKSKPNLSQPRRKLESVISKARKLGYYTFECDARLALGELEFRDNPSAARTHLSELAREAHQRGFELIARKATAMQDGLGVAMK